MPTVLTADMIRAARGLLDWSQLDLAREAKVSQKALSDAERGKKPLTAYTSGKVRKALEGGNVQFIAENDERNELVGAGVRWRSKRGSLRIKVV
jgi:transcriptional regulator with XRE-family HTH domain